LIKGDLDSLRLDVQEFYTSKVHFPDSDTCKTILHIVQGVQLLKDEDQYSTDLMKCVDVIAEKEESEGQGVH
jgi:thiamine pyrophosphokinase